MRDTLVGAVRYKGSEFSETKIRVRFFARSAPSFTACLNVIVFRFLYLHFIVRTSDHTIESTSITPRHKSFAERIDVYKCRDSFNGLIAHKRVDKTQKEKRTQT